MKHERTSGPSDQTGPQTLRLLRGAKRYNGWLFRAIRPYLGHEILEVGAGIGTMTELLAGSGRVTASDISEDALAELRRVFKDSPQVRVRRLDLGERVFDEEGRYDTIVSLNVLEHIEDDVQALKNLHPLLAPAGRLVLFVPAGRRLYGSIDQRLGHYRRYEKEDLAGKLSLARYRISYLRYHNPLGALGWWIRGKALRRHAIAALDVAAFEWLMPLMELQELFESRFSLSLLAVGEKP